MMMALDNQGEQARGPKRLEKRERNESEFEVSACDQTLWQFLTKRRTAQRHKPSMKYLPVQVKEIIDLGKESEE